MAYHGPSATSVHSGRGEREHLTEQTQRIDPWPETGGGEAPAGLRADRLVVHGVWEAFLAVAVVLIGFATYRADADALTGVGLQSFLLLAATIGFMAVGLGWSVRGAVPNLAVGTVAVAAATLFSHQIQGGIWFGIAVTLAAAAAVGVLLGVLVVAFHVPAWAGSLALVLLLGGWLVRGRAGDPAGAGGYQPDEHALYWFIGFVVLSLLGGLLGIGEGFRKGVGGFRTTGDPAERPGFAPGLSALAALVGSCVLAAVGGILAGLDGTATGFGSTGVEWTGLALGAVLLGGTSGFGRRAGVTGTVLAVLLVGFGIRLVSQSGWGVGTVEVAGITVVLGLLVTRLVERYAKPRAGRDEASAPEAPDVPVDTVVEGPRLPAGRAAGRAVLALPAGRSAVPEPPGYDRTARFDVGGQGRAAERGAVAGTLRMRGGIGDRASRLRHFEGVAGGGAGEPVAGRPVPGYGRAPGTVPGAALPGTALPGAVPGAATPGAVPGDVVAGDVVPGTGYRPHPGSGQGRGTVFRSGATSGDVPGRGRTVPPYVIQGQVVDEQTVPGHPMSGHLAEPERWQPPTAQPERWQPPTAEPGQRRAPIWEVEPRDTPGGPSPY